VERPYGTFQRKALFSLAHGTIMWGILLARNPAIFEDVMPDWNSVSELILHHLSLWLKSAGRIFSYSGSDLLRGSEGLLSWTNKT
jgi:hypothetical protein